MGPAEMPAPQPPDIPEWPPEQLMACEKETLGYYVTGHPLDRFSDELSRFSKKTLADLISDGAGVECRVAGIVTECRVRRTKKGELMAVFTLEDLTGAVEAVVFPSSYAKYEAYLAADTPVCIAGRFEVDENACKIICSDIQPLTGIAERNAKTLCIRVSVPGLRPEAARELQLLLEQNRGETGVDVELYHPDEFRVTIQSSEFVKVKSSPELIGRVEEICGVGSVRVKM
jgi:DNA polymerase-3 subunit alpha